MAFSAKVGAFNVSTAAAGNTQAITGVGFQPKAVIFWWSGRTDSTDTVGRLSMLSGVGICNASNSRVVAQGSADAAADSDTAALARSDSCIAPINGAAAGQGRMSLSSMDSDGFTLSIGIQMTAAYRVHYLALGGTDLTNTAVGGWTTPGATGNQAVTGVGFQADLVFLLTYVSTGTLPLSSGSIGFGLGAAKSSTARATLASMSRDAQATMQTRRYGLDIECLSMIAGGSALNERADFVSFDADGFTINWLEDSVAGRHCFYLALKGGQYAVGSGLTQTDTVTAITCSPGFQAVAGLIASHMGAESTQDGTDSDNKFSIGAFNATDSRGAHAILDENGNADSTVSAAVEHDAVYANIADGGTIQGLMDISSIGSTSFDLIMDDADPSQNFFWWVAFGSAAGVQYNQSVAGTVTSAGVVANRAGKPLAGALTSAGALINRAGKPLAGTLASAGVLINSTRKGLSGTLTSAGGLVNSARKILNGTLSSAGALTTAMIFGKIIEGVLTSAGALSNQARKVVSGAIAPAGVLLNKTQKVLDGALTSAGTLAQRANKALDGVLAPDGALARLTAKILSGGITPDGVVTKRTSKTVEGTLTSSGILAAVKTALMVVGGTLSMAGDLTRRPGKILAGAIAPDGALARVTLKAVAGIVTSAGGLIRSISKAAGGTLDFIGDLSVVRTFLRALEGALSMAGELVKQPQKVLGGAIAPEGGLGRSVKIVLSGTLGLAGGLAKRAGKLLAGGLASAGTLVAQLVSGIASVPGLATLLDVARTAAGLSDAARTAAGLSDIQVGDVTLEDNAE